MNNKLNTILVVIFMIVGLCFVAGCQSDAQTGSVIGGLAGAGIGQLAGGDTESTLIGAAVGAGTGGCRDSRRARALARTPPSHRPRLRSNPPSLRDRGHRLWVQGPETGQDRSLRKGGMATPGIQKRPH